MYPSFEQLIGTVMDRDVTEWPRMSAIVGTEFEGGVVIFFSMNDGVMLALSPGAGFGDDGLGVPEGAPGDASEPRCRRYHCSSFSEYGKSSRKPRVFASA